MTGKQRSENEQVNRKNGQKRKSVYRISRRKMQPYMKTIPIVDHVSLNLPLPRMKAISDLAPVKQAHDAASPRCQPGIWTSDAQEHGSEVALQVSERSTGVCTTVLSRLGGAWTEMCRRTVR